MRWKRWLKRIAIGLGAAVLALGAFALAVWIYYTPAITRTNGVVYSRRHGHDLTFDIVRPEHPNGIGVLLMVSGGWKSGTNSFHPWMTAPFTRGGYTVFAVYHVSQPEASVQEITGDMHRATRFIRHHAKEYGIDPKRLGVTGGSAGGHLSLMLATRGGPGPADAPDPVDRESSAVQAVAIFYPVTDLVELGDSTENQHDGGPPKSFVKAFGPGATNPAVWAPIARDLSPIHHLSSNLPPTLIYHGGADTLVVPDQSLRYKKAARELGNTVEVVIVPGGHHGWPSMLLDVFKLRDWFDRYLGR